MDGLRQTITGCRQSHDCWYPRDTGRKSIQTYSIGQVLGAFYKQWSTENTEWIDNYVRDLARDIITHPYPN